MTDSPSPTARRGRTTVVIAAGGTGGHVFPGLAVADALRARGDVHVVFAGTPRGLEGKIIPAQGYDLEMLHALPLKGGGPARAGLAAAVAARETVRAAARIRRLKPSALLSVGGYAAGPMALAAALLGVPVSLLEPNSVPGFANRIMAPLARRVFVAWPEVAQALGRKRSRVVGVPLRTAFAPSRYQPPAAGQPARVVVLGGSQGAAALNERLPEALGRAVADLHKGPAGAARREVEILHQTGEGREAAVAAAYARELSGSHARATARPFLDDVAGALQQADLVVARAGAVTLAEIAAVGRASLLVPFPFAADDHQWKNAQSFAELGACVCLRQEAADTVRLATELGRLLGDDALRGAMAGRARAHGKPEAAATVARELLEVA